VKEVGVLEIELFEYLPVCKEDGCFAERLSPPEMKRQTAFPGISVSLCADAFLIEAWYPGGTLQTLRIGRRPQDGHRAFPAHHHGAAPPHASNQSAVPRFVAQQHHFAGTGELTAAQSPHPLRAKTHPHTREAEQTSLKNPQICP
jgi:hypothetical protein